MKINDNRKPKTTTVKVRDLQPGQLFEWGWSFYIMLDAPSSLKSWNAANLSENCIAKFHPNNPVTPINATLEIE